MSGHPLVWHGSNGEFQSEISRRRPTLVCIDGPCGTNGPRISTDQSPWCWDTSATTGTRGGELALSRDGVSLFWTTQNTVFKFDGASRWIARSLVLFSDCPGQPKIETHPHGAFTLLWRLFGGLRSLPKKSKPEGRHARVSILRSFIANFSEEMAPNHDAIDAACASLVAGLHQLGLTVAYGSTNDGGQIWMPDTEKLRALVGSQTEAIDV